MSATIESQGQVRPWRPSDILPWVGLLGLIIGVVSGGIWWAATYQTRSEVVLSKLSEVQANLSSIRADISNLPRLNATQEFQATRLKNLEDSQATQDDRIGRVGDAVAALRGEIRDLQGEVRAITRASQVPLPAPGRSPR
ncbi:hypothetical protein RQ831_04040 [Roseomonas gilardii]|uniref:Uncharacterized protein n=1 Tax=Roseomonas gilardii TaxID=257708 RepID=A0ABU3MBI9_9PROT|nr:hypothetical protein [Roseomonas gilardii]MDT8330212.1 hypothetical protein [Roseomonas gilardii]